MSAAVKPLLPLRRPIPISRRIALRRGAVLNSWELDELLDSYEQGGFSTRDSTEPYPEDGRTRSDYEAFGG